ncbi:hypothetical protein ACF0H5_014972 [Mactra antiquata]
MKSEAMKILYYEDKESGHKHYKDDTIEDHYDHADNVSGNNKDIENHYENHFENDDSAILNIPNLNQSHHESAPNSMKNASSNRAASKSKFSHMNLKEQIMNETDFKRKPLMILFSSWVFSKEKMLVHAVLRRNWKSWASIKPAVLTRDHIVRNDCRRQGWMVRGLSDVDRACYGPPVLSSMFTDLFKNNDAYFYGYSNADIVYGDGLEETLKFIFYHFSPWKTKPILIVGRRYNVNFVKYKNESWRTPADIARMAKYGQLVIRSTDYFFTNKHFPWGKAPGVSIGRPYVVRAIIAWALRSGFHVIDATRTIESVHMTTQDGVYASWHTKGVTCNQRILAALKWSIPTYIGHCECARMETFRDEEGSIQIRRRPPSKKICSRTYKNSK